MKDIEQGLQSGEEVEVPATPTTIGCNDASMKKDHQHSKFKGVAALRSNVERSITRLPSNIGSIGWEENDRTATAPSIES